VSDRLVRAAASRLSSRSGGYSDTRIGQDTVLVSFKGNGYTSKERVQLYLLYRCAEVIRQYGYDYFVVATGGTDAQTNYFLELLV
jgi:hypothetical protein